LDTSYVSTHYINNPRTVNAIYSLGPRILNALRLGQETLGGGSLNNAQLNNYVPPGSPLTKFFKPPDTVWTPRGLKDGADSVGALGALNRGFVNICLFSEEWLEHFRPFIGGKPMSPFPIKVARKNSSYWNANEMQTPDLALFFLATAKPDYLKNAPGGEGYLTGDQEKLARGKEMFAERCARCHSSKLPEKAYSFLPNGCVGPRCSSALDPNVSPPSHRSRGWERAAGRRSRWRNHNTNPQACSCLERRSRPRDTSSHFQKDPAGSLSAAHPATDRIGPAALPGPFQSRVRSRALGTASGYRG
jgi:hypothetical protein